jgi:hypothetical protein
MQPESGADMEDVGYTIRMPRALHGQLKAIAGQQHRSVNAQIVHYLTQAVHAEQPIAVATQSLDSESVHGPGQARARQRAMS